MSRDRGDRRSSRNGGAVSAIARARALTRSALAGGFWFDADNSTGVSALVDVLDPAHTLAIAGTLAPSAANAAFGGAKTFSFTGTQYGTSNRANALFQYLHDGSSWDTITVLAPKDTGGTNRYNAILHTADVSTLLDSGVALAFYGTTLEDSGFAVMRNNAGGRAVDQNGGAVLANVATYLRWTYGEALTPKWQYWNKAASISSSSITNSPSALAPTSTLIFGAKPGGTQGMICDWRATYTKPGRFTAAELSAITTLIALETGIS